MTNNVHVPRHVAQRRRPTVRLAASQHNDRDGKHGDGEDEDGWGTTTSTSTPASSKSMAEMTEELRSLQTPNQPTSTLQKQTRQGQDPQERDLFIPIFAVVSLLGLFGSYGYEMLRLYSRGELYLPWMDNN